MLKFASTAFLIFLTFSAIAQKQNVYFLKNNGKYVSTKDSADYIRIISPPDSGSVLYSVTEFYKGGQKKLVAKSSKIDPPRFEGECATFYRNGNKKSLENYKAGILVGPQYYYYPNGQLYVIKEFPDNGLPTNEFTDNYLIKENYDSLGTVKVRNGNGYFKAYDNYFIAVQEEGKLINGKRDSTWKGEFETLFGDLKVTFSEMYKDGILIKGVAVDRLGINTIYIKSRATAPEFKGGINEFYKYLGSNIRYPRDARRNNTQGTVILDFVIEKDGTVANVVVKRSVSRTIDAEAIKVITNSPPWVAGTQFGRNVRCSYTIPLSFTLSN
jgi:TonB family protein